MKNAIITLILISALFACQKEPGGKDPVGPPDNQDTTFLGMEPNSLSVTRNGKKWKTTNNITIYIGGTNPKQMLMGHDATKDGLREIFDIMDIPLIVGHYTLISNPIGYWHGKPFASIGWIYDGDQVIGGLEVDTLYSKNYLEIVEYDSLTRIVKGKFEARLTAWYLANYPAFWDPDKIISDTMLLTNGKFVVKVPE